MVSGLCVWVLVFWLFELVLLFLRKRREGGIKFCACSLHSHPKNCNCCCLRFAVLRDEQPRVLLPRHQPRAGLCRLWAVGASLNLSPKTGATRPASKNQPFPKLQIQSTGSEPVSTSTQAMAPGVPPAKCFWTLTTKKTSMQERKQPFSVLRTSTPTTEIPTALLLPLLLLLLILRLLLLLSLPL